MNLPIAVRNRFMVGWVETSRLELLFIAGFLLTGWFNPFCEMWDRWFPVWKNSSISVMDRLTSGDSYYTHGPLVPLVSLILAVYIYRRKGSPTHPTQSSTIVGWISLFIFSLVHLTGIYARVTFVSGFALIGVIGSLTLLWGGWPRVRTYIAPLLLLFFMVPLPMSWIADLNFTLKSFAGRSAVWIASEVFHIPAFLDGSYVLLSPDSAGHSRSLILENVCSGLRSLIALMWFSSVFIAISRISRPWRFIFVLLTIPLAIGCNIIRILGLVSIAHIAGPSAAGPHSWVHSFFGLLMFSIAIGILYGLERLLPCHPSPSSISGRSPFLFTPTCFHHRRLSLGVLAVVAGASLLGARSNPVLFKGNFVQQAVAQQLNLQGLPFAGQDMKLAPKILAILETRDYVCRNYVNPSTGQSVELLVVFSPDNRKATHPPDVCLEGNGQSIIDRRKQQIDLSDGSAIPMKELLTQRGSDLRYYLYVYKCGTQYTPDFFSQQANIFFNSLLNQNTSGALIRFSLPVTGRNLEEARSLAFSAVRSIIPQLNRGLP